MKNIFILSVLFIFFSSCSLKDATENGFQTKSEITPFAQATTLAEEYGNGREAVVTLKVPLTEDSIGFFDVDEVLGNSELNAEKRNFFERLYDKLRVRVYNIFVKLGFSNKLQYSTFFDFPQIDTDLIVSAKVKKVFFTTEDCRPEERNCNDQSRSTSNFNFLSTFFVNVSAANEEVTTDGLVDISSDDFKEIEKESFRQNLKDANSIMGIKKYQNQKNVTDETTPIESENKVGINLVKFKNNVPYLNLNTSKVNEDDIYLTFHISKQKLKLSAKRYFKMDKFREIVKRAKMVEEGVEVTLRKNVKSSELFQQISKDQSFTAQNMFIFRLDGHYIETKKYFEQERFSHLIEDTTMIGRSLFVELKNDNNQREFLSIINTEKEKMDSELSIYEIQRCDGSNCLDLEVKDINLVPLLSKSNKVKIDTFLSVRALGSSDFKYNGYLEVEVKWLPPL